MVSGRIEATSADSARARLAAQFITVAYIRECPQPLSKVVWGYVFVWGMFSVSAGAAFAALVSVPELALLVMCGCWAGLLAVTYTIRRAAAIEAARTETESNIAAERAEIAATRKQLALTAAELEADARLGSSDPNFAASLGASEDWLRKMAELQAALNPRATAPAKV